MKCEKCGYSLQIEDEFCPGCGTANPFAKAHREDMERYGKAFQDTQEAVLDRTKKTTGVMIKIIVSLILLVVSIFIFLLSGNTSLRKAYQARKVQANIQKYRTEFSKYEEDKDYIGLKEWFGVNHLNEVAEFKDCLNVYNVCENYEFLSSYLAQIACEDYVESEIKYGFRSADNYCESIVDCFSMMLSYAEREEESSTGNSVNVEFNNSCIEQTKVLIQATFKLTNEQMEQFVSISDIEKTSMLMENWPYEK